MSHKFAEDRAWASMNDWPSVSIGSRPGTILSFSSMDSISVLPDQQERRIRDLHRGCHPWVGKRVGGVGRLRWRPNVCRAMRRVDESGAWVINRLYKEFNSSMSSAGTWQDVIRGYVSRCHPRVRGKMSSAGTWQAYRGWPQPC